MKHYLQKIHGTSIKIVAVIIFIFALVSVFQHTFKKDSRQIQKLSLEETTQFYEKQVADVLNNKENNNTPLQKIAVSVIRGNICIFAGLSCANNNTHARENFNNSIVGMMSKAVTVPLVNPPASGIENTMETLAGAGLVPKSYAAEGIGFGSIAAFRKVWTIFRNISYGFLVVMMVSIGIMIMFRFNLKAQTAISIENSLPRIIVSLLLITFSYTIAGFMIDIMYLSMALIVSMIGQGIEGANIAELENYYLTAGPGALAGNFFQFDDFFKVSTSLLSILPWFIQIFVAILSGAGTALVTYYIVSLVKSVGITEAFNNFQAFTFGIGGFPGVLVGVAIFLIGSAVASVTVLPLIMFILMALTATFLFFRVFFLLLLTYLRILMLILFAPLFMLFQALPGRNAFSYWFRSLLGELLTFPIITAIFLTGELILTNYKNANNLDFPGTAPPGMWEPPFLYGVNQNAFIIIVGLGLIYMVPDLVKMAKDMLGVKSMPISMGMGTFFGGAAVASAGGSGLLGRGYKMAALFGGQEGVKSLNAFIGSQIGGLKEPFRRRTTGDGTGTTASKS